MKAESFVIAFCLVGAGAWFTYAKHAGNLRIEGNRANEQTIVINSDNFYEEIRYAGHINFNDEETAITALSPGGYLKYTRDDQLLTVVADSSGRIVYTLSQNGHVTNNSADLPKIISEAVKETIAWGLDAKPRMERVYNRGGSQALLNAIDSLKNGNLKLQYAERIFRADSVSTAVLERLLIKLHGIDGSDYEKEQLLKKFSVTQLADSSLFSTYLQTVAAVRADDAKTNLLKKLIELPSLQQHLSAIVAVISSSSNEEEKARALNAVINKAKTDSSDAAIVLQAISGLHNEEQKQALISNWISKGSLPDAPMQVLLDVISGLGNENYKAQLYKKLATNSLHAEVHWLLLLDGVARLGQNELKAALLIDLSQKMPKTDGIKAAYLKTAKTITTDADYGRVLRAAG
jgi:hypothetical protein